MMEPCAMAEINILSNFFLKDKQIIQNYGNQILAEKKNSDMLNRNHLNAVSLDNIIFPQLFLFKTNKNKHKTFPSPPIKFITLSDKMTK